jgi:uncharacterized Zn finger protein (UPF0148 family)
MPLVIKCEHCQAPLKLPEEYIGKEVRCPSCQREFVAREELQSPPPRPRPEEERSEEDRPPPREEDRPSRRRYDDEDRPRRPRDDDEDYERPSRRARRYDDDFGRRLEPHRGSSIQTMGILSLCLFCIPIASIILGICALTMANTDLSKMRAGYMDPSGESATNTGKTCGIIGLVVTALYIFGMFCLGCAGGAGGPHHR